MLAGCVSRELAPSLGPAVTKLYSMSIMYTVFPLQDPAGIFELIEVVGNGTYGQVHKVLDTPVGCSRGPIRNVF